MVQTDAGPTCTELSSKTDISTSQKGRSEWESADSGTSAGEGEGWGALDEGCPRIKVASGKSESEQKPGKRLSVNGGTVAEEAIVQGPHSAPEEEVKGQVRKGDRVDGSTPMMSGFLSVCYSSLLVRYSLHSLKQQHWSGR